MSRPLSNRTSASVRKDADHEFFNMTLLAQVLSHPRQKQLIEMQADADKLF